MFDADSAGLKAAVRSLDISEEANVNIRIGMLPEGDPFDFITGKGPREFMAVVDKSIEPVDFRIERIMDNYQSLGRVATLLQMFGVIRELRLETERSLYLKKVSSLLDVDENSARADFRNYLNRPQAAPVKTEQAAKSEQADFITRSYRDLIKLICNYPVLIEKAVIDYNLNDIPDELSRGILKKISELYYQNQQFSIDKIFDFFNTGPEMDFLNKAFNSEFSKANPNAAYSDIFIRIKESEIDDKIKKYTTIVNTSPGENTNVYLTEIEVLKREKEKLKDYVYNKVT
jgi:DNA primase